MASRVERLEKRKKKVEDRFDKKAQKSRKKSAAKSEKALAKGKTKKDARIQERALKKRMRMGFATGARLSKIEDKIVKAGGPATVTNTGKPIFGGKVKTSALRKQSKKNN